VVVRNLVAPPGRVKRRRARSVALAAAALASFTVSAPAQTPAARELVVRGLGFRGNRAIDDYTLRLSIATSQSAYFQRNPLLSWLTLGERRYLNEVEFRRDVLRIQALYRQSGFVDATVDTIVRREGGDAHITFVVHEGIPVTVRAITVEGVEGLIDPDDLLRSFPLHAGDPFNRLLMQAAADSVRFRLANQGYPFSEVFRNFDVDLESRSATIRFAVDPGPRARIGAVEIVGARRLDESVIRRAIPLEPGALFRQRDLYTSQLDLYRMEMFDYVQVEVPPDSTGAQPDSLVTVRIRLTEGPLRRLRVGLGYGTIDCFRTSAAWDLHNVFGGGRTLRLNARLAQFGAGQPVGLGFENTLCPVLAAEDTSRLKLNYNVGVSLSEPYLFTRRASGAVTLFAERYTEYQAYLRDAVGGDLAVTYRLGPGFPVTFSYGLAYGSTRAEPATFCTFLDVCELADIEQFQRRVRRVVAGALIVRDRRNSVLDPTRGTRLSLEVRHASPAIGSDTLSHFTKGTMELSAHHPVGRRSVVSWRVRAGALGSGRIGATGSELRYVPTEERFYAGGASTVRGFGQNELGPLVRVLDTVFVRQATVDGVAVTRTDSVIRTSATGGDVVLLANVEFRFPLPGFSSRVAGAVYLDAGRLYDRSAEGFLPERIRVTPGFGFRYASPLGPVRLDIAVNPYAPQSSPLYVREGNQLVLADPAYVPAVDFLGRFRIHFSVGQPF
jgi:outer membrane protein assembly factor BamA